MADLSQIKLPNGTVYDLKDTAGRAGYQKAITTITRSGTTFTYTCVDGTTGTFSQRDNDTIPAAYCSTAAATAAKVASCTGYVLTNNTWLHLIVTTANTSKTALTLNVNSKGAKTIYINGTASSTSNYTLPAGSYLVFYDGTGYQLRTDGKLPGVSYITVSGTTLTIT